MSSVIGSISVRLARDSEREALEALQWRASLANPGDAEALRAHPDAIELPASQIEAGLVFVAERERAVLGFAALLHREDGDIELDGLFVDPAMQRGGAGRALIMHCMEFARAHGARAIHVVGNFHAAAFYRVAGFVVVGECQTRFGPALSLRLGLEGVAR